MYDNAKSEPIVVLPPFQSAVVDGVPTSTGAQASVGPSSSTGDFEEQLLAKLLARIAPRIEPSAPQPPEPQPQAPVEDRATADDSTAPSAAVARPSAPVLRTYRDIVRYAHGDPAAMWNLLFTRPIMEM